MKSSALVLLAAILTTIAASSRSHAAQRLSATQMAGRAPFSASEAVSDGADVKDKLETENDSGGEKKEPPGQRTRETGIKVMSRGEVDPSTLKTGSFAHVVYTTEGIEGVAWGVIARIDPDGILIESEAAPFETRKTAFGDINILAVAEDRLTFESWLNARLAAEKITVMSRKDLDLSKLTTGWYAHAVYTWRGLKKTASGKVLEIDADGIVIKSGAERPETWKITASEIDTLAFAKTLQALERWQRWTQSGILRMSRWDLNPSML